MMTYNLLTSKKCLWFEPHVSQDDHNSMSQLSTVTTKSTWHMDVEVNNVSHGIMAALQPPHGACPASKSKL